MKYPTMNATDAAKYIELVKSGQNPSPTTYVKWVGESPRLSEEIIKNAVEQVRAIKGKYPETLRFKDPVGKVFEAEAGEAFRRALDIPPEVSGDKAFWRYVAVVYMFDIVTWRFPPQAEGDFTALPNFGLGTVFENMPARMWFRFEVARLPGAEDPFELCRLGDQDFWRSHILRIRFGASRHIIRTFLNYQFPKENGRQPFLPMSSDPSVGIRMFIKRIQRYHATTSFEVLTEDEALAIMHELGKDLQKKAA